MIVFFLQYLLKVRYRHEYKTYNTKTNFSKYSLGCKTFDLYPSVGKKLESFNTKQQIQQKVVSLETTLYFSGEGKLTKNGNKGEELCYVFV